MQNQININTKHTYLHDQININQMVETQLKVKKKIRRKDNHEH